MSRLYDPSGEPWNTGAATCMLPSAFNSFFVRAQFEAGRPTLSLMDTGAPVTILGCRLADMAGVKGTGRVTDLDIVWASYSGRMGRCALKIEGDIWGDDLILQADIVVVDGWDRYPILGLKGVLDSIRFALDQPQNKSSKGVLMFAPLA